MSRRSACTPSDPVPADVPDAELAVLEQLWASAPRTVRQLTDALYPGGRAAHYGTVQKLLQRLEARGCVGRIEGRSPLEFEALVARDDLVARRVDAVVDRLCAGSLTPLLSHLARRELRDDEVDALRALLRDMEGR